MNRILVVEDSLTTQLLIQSSLEKTADIKCVATIAEAEKELNQSKYDLFILDVLLPDGDGFDLCHRIRNRPNFAETPLIF